VPPRQFYSVERSGPPRQCHSVERSVPPRQFYSVERSGPPKSFACQKMCISDLFFSNSTVA